MTKKALCILICSLGLSCAALAQTFPARPIRLVVGYAPGGPNDILARLLAQKLAERLGQNVIVDNRPGADSIIATEMVARSAPDGHTLLMTTGSHTMHPSVYNKLPYDIVRDFAPIMIVAATGYIVVVHPSVPVASMKELIALAKAKPGQLTYASAGAGGPNHLGVELFKSMAGIDMVHVPYKGGAPAITDLVGGQVQLMFSAMAPALPQVKAGKLRALAVSSARRSAAVPELPTVAEAALPGFEVTGWYGLMAPAATPRRTVDRLHSELVAILKLPDVAERLLAIGVEPVGDTPEQMLAYMKTEIAKWSKVTKASGISLGAVQ
jgi:tripartite-type tricarboxylate transporter receptor subunit TctC